MTNLLEELKQILRNLNVDDISPEQVIVEHVQKHSRFLWQAHYPIAVIHSKKRMHDKETVLQFESENLFDRDGLTPTQWQTDQLEFVADNAPKYLQSVSLMCLKKTADKPLAFAAKRENDYWKKIQNSEHIEAMAEVTSFTKNGDNECQVESALREIIRKRKEISALKGVAFISIAVARQGQKIDRVMTHYFHDNHSQIHIDDSIIHIGWSETLKAINMRYFVCPPTKQLKEN